MLIINLLIVKPEVKIEILITVNPGNRTVEFKIVGIDSLFSSEAELIYRWEHVA